MTKEIKDLIDALDEENQHQIDHEINMRNLKEEVGRLKFTIKEQKMLIQEQKKKLLKTTEVPEDIKLLKELIISQRQEIKKKDKDIDILKEKVAELDVIERTSYSPNSSEELINAQKRIVQLSEEIEMYRLNEANAKNLIEELNEKYGNEIEGLKTQLSNLKLKKSKKIRNLEKENNNELQINNLNKQLAQLREENEKLIKNLDTAQTTHNKLVDEINTNLTEISQLGNQINEKNIKIEALKEKYESQKRINRELKKNLVNTKKPNLKNSLQTIDVISENSLRSNKSIMEENLKLKEEIKKLKERITQFSTSQENKSKNEITNMVKKLKQDNKNLNNLISELIQNQTEMLNYNLEGNNTLPHYYLSSIFTRFFNIMDEEKRSLLIQTLIHDLINSKNFDIKRLLIKILSNFKDERIYETFSEIIADADWIIRLYVVKTLSKLDNSDLKVYFKEPLQNLLKDNDPDVRDAVKFLLNKIL